MNRAFIIGLMFIGLSCNHTPLKESMPPSTEDEVHAALKKANPEYTGQARITTDDQGIIWKVNLRDCKVSDLSPLNGMPLRWIRCSKNSIADLSPLQEMKLEQLICSENPIEDLSPLTGMPMEILDLSGTDVLDLTPLEGMQLKMIGLDPGKVEKGMEVLKGMESLIAIFTEPDKDAGKGVHVRSAIRPEKFWEQYDKGEFK